MFGRDLNPIGSPFRVTNTIDHEENIDPQNVDLYGHIMTEYLTMKRKQPDPNFNYDMFTRWGTYGLIFSPFAGIFGHASAKLFKKTGFFKYA